MTIVRIGATKKYSDRWESAFGKGKKKAAAKKTRVSAKKKSAAKTKKKSKK